jgi:SAM-dependent methyltransferase
MDEFATFKAAQKAGWAHFAPLQAFTTIAAARLVKYAGVSASSHVLDVACGTGVVAVTAARMGARTAGLDLTPELLEAARHNARTAGVEIDWREGDAERLPFEDGAFDIVVSQFGHMFAPRPDVAIGEMLRVVKLGGTVAFSTWPPELFIGRMFALIGRYSPPPPPGVASPPQWGDPTIIRERLGGAVRDVFFDHARMLIPALSPAHARENFERTAGPMIKLVETLGASDPQRLALFRREFETLVAEYYEDNLIRQDYLMTRATKG